MNALNSFDEWTQLHEVILGTSIGYTSQHFDDSFKMFYFDNILGFMESSKFKGHKKVLDGSPVFDLPINILDELEEDIEGLAAALRQEGVRILRPERAHGSNEIVTPWWSSTQVPPLNVRDQAIILGNTIVETAPHVRGRIFENSYMYEIFSDYHSNGARWICMPKPRLQKGLLDVDYQRSRHQNADDFFDDVNIVSHPEIVFDAAQCMKFGKDIIVNVASESHVRGLQWLEREFGAKFNFHRLDKMADSHIDSIIVPLRPGLALLRNKKYLGFLPENLQRWDFIYPPAPKEDRFPNYQTINIQISSKFIDLNVLSINEEKVIVNSLYPELIRELEHRKFTVVPVQHRHRRLFGGGFHCFTLDTVRSGQIESYF